MCAKQLGVRHVDAVPSERWRRREQARNGQCGGSRMEHDVGPLCRRDRIEPGHEGQRGRDGLDERDVGWLGVGDEPVQRVGAAGSKRRREDIVGVGHIGAVWCGGRIDWRQSDLGRERDDATRQRDVWGIG